MSNRATGGAPGVLAGRRLQWRACLGLGALLVVVAHALLSVQFVGSSPPPPGETFTIASESMATWCRRLTLALGAIPLMLYFRRRCSGIAAVLLIVAIATSLLPAALLWRPRLSDARLRHSGAEYSVLETRAWWSAFRYRIVRVDEDGPLLRRVTACTYPSLSSSTVAFVPARLRELVTPQRRSDARWTGGVLVEDGDGVIVCVERAGYGVRLHRYGYDAALGTQVDLRVTESDGLGDSRSNAFRLFRREDVGDPDELTGVMSMVERERDVLLTRGPALRWRQSPTDDDLAGALAHSSPWVRSAATKLADVGGVALYPRTCRLLKAVRANDGRGD